MFDQMNVGKNSNDPFGLKKDADPFASAADPFGTKKTFGQESSNTLIPSTSSNKPSTSFGGMSLG